MSEMKEKAWAIRKLFGVENIEALPEKLEEAVFSDNREAIFDSYMDLAGTI